MPASPPLASSPPASLLAVADARARILAPLRPTAAETVGLADAWNRVTAAPVLSRLRQPPADVSAMDGYALRSSDIGPRRVVGAAPAGHPFAGTVGPGEAVRLFTGSVVPDGADTVLIQEDATRHDDLLTASAPPRPGAHIRAAGQDFGIGDVLIPPGTRLGARAVGLAAAGNHAWLSVHRRPTVAILATGDEISLPGDPIGPGGIVSSNAHALAAFVHARGGRPVVLPIARDTGAAIAEAAAAARGADLLVTTGGASVGEHDLVQAGLSAEGFVLDFWKIAMRPGKPLIAGRLGDIPVLGLPGNPVSALVCAVLFLGPALDRLQGLPGAAPATVPARLGAPLPGNDARADHLRATLDTDAAGALVATAFGRQDSSMLRALHRAHALILREPHAPPAPEGTPVAVIRLQDMGI